MHLIALFSLIFTGDHSRASQSELEKVAKLPPENCKTPTATTRIPSDRVAGYMRRIKLYSLIGRSAIEALFTIGKTNRVDDTWWRTNESVRNVQTSSA